MSNKEIKNDRETELDLIAEILLRDELDATAELVDPDAFWGLGSSETFGRGIEFGVACAVSAMTAPAPKAAMTIRRLFDKLQANLRERIDTARRQKAEEAA